MFFALFGAVALVGAVGAASMQVLKGPVRSMAEITKRTVAETNMLASTKLAIIGSANQTGADCDSDGFIEPIQPDDPTTNPAPAGGGFLPATIGAALNDPWDTRFAYCAWDHGGTTTKCAGAKPMLLTGGELDNQYAIAVISAGADRMFQTACNDFVDLNTDDIPDTALLLKNPGSDDIVLGYTYAEANNIGGGLWTLKDSDTSKATINKDIEVRNAADTETIFGLDRTTGQAEFMAIKTDNIFAKSAGSTIQFEDLFRVKGYEDLVTPTGGGGGGDSLWTAGAGDNIYREDGDVGIGTTSPQALLHLSDLVGSPNIRFDTEASLGGADSATSPTYGSAGVNDSAVGGSNTWTNPGNATTSNNSKATRALTSGGGASQYLKVTGFGFVLPSDAQVSGIQVEVEKMTSSTASSSSCQDNAVRIVKGGTVTGDDKKNTGVNWATSDTFDSYGDLDGDSWGAAWTPADINAANFGVAISALNSGATSRTCSVDAVRITVSYYNPDDVSGAGWTMGVDSADEAVFRISAGASLDGTGLWLDHDGGDPGSAAGFTSRFADGIDTIGSIEYNDDENEVALEIGPQDHDVDYSALKFRVKDGHHGPQIVTDYVGAGGGDAGHTFTIVGRKSDGDEYPILHGDENGFVGVDTTTPLAEFQVGAHLSFGGNWPWVGFNTYWDDDVEDWKYHTNDSASVIIQHYDNDGLEFMTAVPGTAGSIIPFNIALSLADNGNVGIGTSDPSRAKLVVNGSVGYDNGNYGYLNSSGGVGTSSGSVLTSIWSSDRVVAGEFNAYSDARVKSEITHLPDALKTLSQLNVVAYNKHSKGGGPAMGEMGVIGQEAWKAFPLAVRITPGDVMDANGNWTEVKDFHQVNYQTLSMLGLQALQELDRKVEDLATASPKPAADSFGARFFAGLKTRLVAWFADAENGITDLFARVGNFGRVNTDKLCVGSTCVTEDEFRSLQELKAENAKLRAEFEAYKANPPQSK